MIAARIHARPIRPRRVALTAQAILTGGLILLLALVLAAAVQTG
jgi:hypothetical protein